MVSKLFIPELIFCIVAIIAYYGYYGAKYRKAPKFFVLAAWGIGAYFLFNAFSNAMFLILVQVLGEATFKSLATNNSIILVTIQIIFGAISVVFITRFVIKQMRNRNVFVNDKSVDMSAYLMGAGSLFTPFLSSSLLMVFIQAVVNVAVLITNPTGEGIKGVSIEQFNALKAFYLKLPNMYFVSMLLDGVIIALILTLVFKYIYDTFEKSSRTQIILPGVFYFAVVMLSVLITYIVPNSILQSLLRVLILGGLVYLCKSYSKLMAVKK